jgi:hypothetical protein
LSCYNKSPKEKQIKQANAGKEEIMKVKDLICTIPMETEISIYVYGNALRFRGTVETYYEELKYIEVNETLEMKVTRIKAIDYNEITINIE